MNNIDFFDGKKSIRSSTRSNMQNMHIRHAEFFCQPAGSGLAFFSHDFSRYSAPLTCVARFFLERVNATVVHNVLKFMTSCLKMNLFFLSFGSTQRKAFKVLQK